MLDKTAIDELSLTLQFYDLILPGPGFRIVEYKKPRSKGMQRAFAATNEELADLVRQLDQEGSEVYHACSTYKKELNIPRARPSANGALVALNITLWERLAFGSTAICLTR